MRWTHNVTCLIAFMSWTTGALATVDAEGFMGQRTAKMSGGKVNDSMTGKEYGLAAHYHPMTGVPIGVGAFATITDYEVSTDNSIPMDQLSGQEAGLDIRVVLPVDALGIKAISRLGYTIWGEYKGMLNDARHLGGGMWNETSMDSQLAYKMRSRGLHVSAGVAYSPVVLMSLVLMFDYSRQKVDVQDMQVYDMGSGNSGLSLQDMPSELRRLETGSYNHESRAFILGLELGV